MKDIVAFIAVIVVFSAIVAFFESKYKKLSPAGKYNPSFKHNFLRNMLIYGLIVALIQIVRIWF